MGDLFNTLFIYPIINILVFGYQLFSALHVPYALGFAIILLTIVIRLILYPLMAAQLRASKKMQELQPHMNTLKERHKGDSRKLQEETMKLYKEHGVNPAAGCLPLLIQLPILIGLYNVLAHLVAMQPQEAMNYINSIVYSDQLKLSAPWDTSFFGIPLGQKPSDLIHVMPLIILIPVITAALQFVQSKMMVPAKPAEAAPGKKKQGKKALAKGGEEKKDSATEFAQAFQTQALYIFPLMLGYLSYSFPVGLSLYWNTFTLFGILQQYQISGWGAMESWLPKRGGRK